MTDPRTKIKGSLPARNDYAARAKEAATTGGLILNDKSKIEVFGKEGKSQYALLDIDGDGIFDNKVVIKSNDKFKIETLEQNSTTYKSLMEKKAKLVELKKNSSGLDIDKKIDKELKEVETMLAEYKRTSEPPVQEAPKPVVEPPKAEEAKEVAPPAEKPAVEVKENKETAAPAEEPKAVAPTKEKMAVETAIKVTNPKNVNGSIEGKVVAITRDDKNNITSLTVKSDKSGNEFSYKYDEKTKHFVDSTGKKFYAMAEDGTLVRNNALNPPSPAVITKGEYEDNKDIALATKYADMDLETGDPEIIKKQNKQLLDDVKAGKNYMFSYNQETKKIESKYSTYSADIEGIRQSIKDCKTTKKDKTAENTKTAKDKTTVARFANVDFTTQDTDKIAEQDKMVMNAVKSGQVFGFKYDSETKKIQDKDGTEKTVADVKEYIKGLKQAATDKRTENKGKSVGVAFANMDLTTQDPDKLAAQNKLITQAVKDGRVPGFKFEDGKITKEDGTAATIENVRSFIQTKKDVVKTERKETVKTSKDKALVLKYNKVDLTSGDADIIAAQNKQIKADVAVGRVPGFKLEEGKITKDGTEVTIDEVRKYIKDLKDTYVVVIR